MPYVQLLQMGSRDADMGHQETMGEYPPNNS